MKIEHFKEIKQKGLNMDLIYLLQKLDEGKEQILVDGITSPLLLTLERKGYILSGLITVNGKELLDSLKEKKIRVKKFPKPDDQFERWWKIYPGTTEFTHKNRHFPGSRAIRVKKEECRVKFEKILEEGITGENMVRALEKEILQKKDESLRTGQNKLGYMQNSLTYLNQRTFEPYIELLGEDKPKSQSNIVDI